jgi:hypothetical protein
MRLLRGVAGDDFEVTKDLDEDEIPPYAILSHTWGPDEDEVSYADIVNRTGSHKSGYQKLAFCAEQARHDGQTYFWVDTCCIDKANNVELNTAITSMFRWYQNAVKCYVYLSDVPGVHTDTDSDSFASDIDIEIRPRNISWLDDFRRCRWLTRGWTLQELLAPKEVVFFDNTGRKLGDKVSLERHICDITGIPPEALHGRLLASYSIEERFAWHRSRQTKKAEDQAYSLAGLCGVSMIPIYGEGRDRAMVRLRKEIEEATKGERLVCLVVI